MRKVFLRSAVLTAFLIAGFVSATPFNATDGNLLTVKHAFWSGDVTDMMTGTTEGVAAWNDAVDMFFFGHIRVFNASVEPTPTPVPGPTPVNASEIAGLGGLLFEEDDYKRMDVGLLVIPLLFGAFVAVGGKAGVV